MPTPPRHFKDELQDWLDGRLDIATCEEVERHLQTCDECRREYESVGWIKHIAAQQLGPVTAPAELRANVLRALRAEPPVVPATHEPEATNVVTPAPGFWRRHQRTVLAAAALVIVSAILSGVYFLRPTPLPAVVARDYRNFQSGQISLQLATADVKAMEAFFAAQGVPFATRVFDLGMMNYTLAGGRVLSLRGQPSAAFAYKGTNNQSLLCQMYAGQVTDLPAGAVRRENKGFTFHVYQRQGLTAVFWQEGTVVCVLVSDIAPEEVIQLAFAKAMPPPG